MKNYYEILEVSPKASNEIIENAYKLLQNKYQPDQYIGEEKAEVENKLRDINEAYKILTDSFLREQYNAELEREQANNKKRYAQSEVEKPKKQREVRQKARRQVKQNVIQEEVQEEQQIPAVGSFGAIVNIVKNLFRRRDREKFDIRKIKREDYIAAGLTAVIIITLGVILWFIPATQGFIRSLVPF